MNTVWLVAYYPDGKTRIELGGIFTTHEEARRAAQNLRLKYANVVYSSVPLNTNISRPFTYLQDVTWANDNQVNHT